MARKGHNRRRRHIPHYEQQRGELAHFALDSLLLDDKWRDLRTVNSKRLRRILEQLADKAEHKGISAEFKKLSTWKAWLAHMYQAEFDYLYKQTALDIFVEPEVPKLILNPRTPKEYSYSLGVPDYLYYSAAANGWIVVEVKTGKRYRGPDATKTRNYGLMAWWYLQRHLAPPHPTPALRSVCWVSYSTGKTAKGFLNARPVESRKHFEFDLNAACASFYAETGQDFMALIA